jgi:hypothetical protein
MELRVKSNSRDLKEIGFILYVLCKKKEWKKKWKKRKKSKRKKKVL